MLYYYLFVYVLVNQKEFQILDQRDGKIKGNVHLLSDLHSLFIESFHRDKERVRKCKGISDSMKNEYESPNDFRTR